MREEMTVEDLGHLLIEGIWERHALFVVEKQATMSEGKFLALVGEVHRATANKHVEVRLVTAIPSPAGTK